MPIDAIRPGENLAEELYALDMSSAELVRKVDKAAAHKPRLARLLILRLNRFVPAPPDLPRNHNEYCPHRLRGLSPTATKLYVLRYDPLVLSRDLDLVQRGRSFLTWLLSSPWLSISLATR